MNLGLYFNGGKHIITREYYTYQVYSFIADIGGYLVCIEHFAFWLPVFKHIIVLCL